MKNGSPLYIKRAKKICKALESIVMNAITPDFDKAVKDYAYCQQKIDSLKEAIPLLEQHRAKAEEFLKTLLSIDYTERINTGTDTSTDTGEYDMEL